MPTSRVSPRRATYFSLLRQRNLRKRKATRWSGSLRFATGNLRCPGKTGGRRKLGYHCVTLKQRAALIPFFRVITGPDRRDRRGKQPTAEQPNSHCAQSLGLIATNSIAGCSGRTCANDTFYAKTGHRPSASAPVLLLPPLGEGRDGGLPETESESAPVPASPVLTGPLSARKNGIRAARCLSRRRVCADPRFSWLSQVARSAAKGFRQPGRLFFGDFLLGDSQKKVTCRRATPASPTQKSKPNPKTNPCLIKPAVQFLSCAKVAAKPLA